MKAYFAEEDRLKRDLVHWPGKGSAISDEASKDFGSAALASSQKPWLETTPIQPIAPDFALAAQRQRHS
jgi:hypothetical protein